MPNLDTVQSVGGLEIFMFRALQDNYCYLVRDPETDTTAVIDTPEVAPIEQALATTGWSLDYILNTHHHWDHAGGNLELKQRTGCQVVGPRADRDRIPGIDIELGDGDTFELGGHRADISAFTSQMTPSPSPATPCSPWAAVDCSRAAQSKCGTHYRNSSRGRTIRVSIAPTSTHNPTRALP